MLTTAAAVWP